MAAGVMELDWTERPREEAALFNPAFCGEMLAHAVHSHQKASGRPLSLPLAFLILPLVLHPASRTGLPGKADTTFRTWAVNNDALLSPLPDRVLLSRPITREALTFLLQHKALALGATGLLPGPSPLVLSRKVEPATAETGEIRRASRFLGRWFAAQGGSGAILQTLGLKP
jgi:hypothetical protein